MDRDTLKLVNLKKKGYSYRTIAPRLKVTPTTVMNRLQRIIARWGEEIFADKDPLLTVGQAAARTGIDSGLISAICYRGQIKTVKSPRGRHLLRQSVADTLKDHPAVTGKRICVICERPFVYDDKHDGTTNTCSYACFKERRRQQYVNWMNRPVRDSSLCEWHRKLKAMVRQHVRPVDEEWLTIDQVVQHAVGLSRIQVWVLHRRRLIKTRRHRTRRSRTGELVVLYPLSLVQLADQVYRNHLQTKTR